MFGLFSLAKCIPYILIGYTRCGCECEAGLSPEHDAHGTVENILSKSALGSRMNWRSAGHMNTETRVFIGLATRPSVERRLMGPAGSRPGRKCRAPLGCAPQGMQSRYDFPTYNIFFKMGISLTHVTSRFSKPITVRGELVEPLVPRQHWHSTSSGRTASWSLLVNDLLRA